MPENRHNVVVFGTGRHGEHYLQRFSKERDYGIDLSSYVDNLAVVDVDEERLGEVKQEYGVDDFYTSPFEFFRQTEGEDYVAFVVTPATTHKDIGTECMKHGLPVLIEKPLAYSTEDSEKLKRVQEKTRVPAACAYQMLFSPPFREVSQFAGQKSIKRFNCEWVKNRGNRNHPIGDIITEDIHPFNYMVFLLGDPQSVSTSGSYMNIRVDPDRRDEAENTPHLEITGEHEFQGKRYLTGRMLGGVDCVFEYPETGAFIQLSFESGRNQRELRMDMVDESIDFEDSNWYDRFFTANLGVSKVPERSIYPFLRIDGGNTVQGEKNWATEHGTGELVKDKVWEEASDELGEEIERFLESVESGERLDPLCSFGDAVATQRVAEGAYQSFVEGKRIEI